jgi:ribonuclease P protein component
VLFTAAASGLFLEPEWFAIPFGLNPSGILMNIPQQPVQRKSHVQSLTGARLRKHADYSRAYAASRKRQSASMSWFLAPQQSAYPGAAPPPGPRVGLTAGKVLGKAHERNRIKRRMREAVRRHVDLLPEGCDLILHPRRPVLTANFTKLEAEVVRILQQANAEAARIAATPVARAAAKPAS